MEPRLTAAQKVVKELAALVDQLESDNTILAAGACPHDDALIGDDHGNFSCKYFKSEDRLARHNKELVIELTKLMRELEETKTELSYLRSQVKGMRLQALAAAEILDAASPCLTCANMGLPQDKSNACMYCMAQPTITYSGFAQQP